MELTVVVYEHLKKCDMETRENYQQLKTEKNTSLQTVIIDSSVTGETDELDTISFNKSTPEHPEDEQANEDIQEDDKLPLEDDLSENNSDLNHNTNDDLSLNHDDDELN